VHSASVEQPTSTPAGRLLLPTSAVGWRFPSPGPHVTWEFICSRIQVIQPHLLFLPEVSMPNTPPVCRRGPRVARGRSHSLASLFPFA
jgi:hypothetical protein